jgi:hypothetical protein
MKPILSKEQFIASYKLQKFAYKAIDKFKLSFPIYSNSNLAKIVSYLTFDGHLRRDMKVFSFASGKISLLKEFMDITEKEFGISGEIRKVPTSYGTSYEYRVISQPLSRVLNLIGTPSGNKIYVDFRVPEWIKESRTFSREYLRVAFDCEGSVWKEGVNRIKIRFGLNKHSKMLDNCMKFLDDMKNMLLDFNIKTTETWFGKGNIRKDGNTTLFLRFNIRSESMSLFKKEIGFNIYHKNKLLEWGLKGHGTS